MSLFRRWLFGLFLLGLLMKASAHDAGLSYGEGRLYADRLELDGSFALADASTLLSAAPGSQLKWTPEEFTARQPALQTLATQLWVVSADGVVIAPEAISTQLWPDDGISLRVVFPLPANAANLTFRAQRLEVFPATHRQFVKITRIKDGAVMEKTLSTVSPTMEIPVTAPVPTDEITSPGFGGFFKLGIDHIWTGYDHLLFLFGLLIVCRRFRSIVIIISCFTLAHSLTLALATLELVILPSRLVEPAIAASIMLVGLENLWRRGEEPRGRAGLTFAFGLIHGFGFASVLRDLGVGSGGQGLGLPLFSFNLGVEAGQIAVASLVLPLVWQLRKQPWFLRRGVPGLSLVVAGAGLYWLVERTVLS